MAGITKVKKEVVADFNAGKDFIVNDMLSKWDGKPINKNQISLTGMTVQFRYNSNRSQFILNVPRDNNR